ncbi:hypothetical protein EF919_38090 [Streptomyces sp. WAC02707]|uniref:hypothetical protein n=1 Tax=Streptomyces sp. WAC02707 TaxID=2487417 RepID=UPI000F77C9DA|nr:hypothetical protein [Streptomyces sp. WAC02707]RSS85288.1 hypothetical protein EF919_38090 [Streptomyces sp. WAC02707]
MTTGLAAIRSSAFTEPERPTGLQIRYATIGGSYVDVVSTNKHLKSSWYCHGCKATSEFPEADYLSRIRPKANDHAGACRAIPLS